MSTTENPSSAPEQAAALLETAELDSTKMVRGAGYPRGFVPILVLLVSFTMSMKGLFPLWVLLVPVVAMVPLLIWLALYSRTRARMRPLTHQSSAGGWYFFAFILLSVPITIWDVTSSTMFAVKFSVTLITTGFLMKRMLNELTNERVKDSNEQAY